MTSFATRFDVSTKHTARTSGLAQSFSMPAVLPALPDLDTRSELLTPECEKDLGFRIMLGQLSLVRALAVDTTIVSEMVQEMWDAIGEKDQVGKAVALLYHEGEWMRAGSVQDAAALPKSARKAAKAAADKEYASIARRKLNSIQTLIAELRSSNVADMEDTLFSVALRDELRRKLSEILPYDYILNRASQRFRAACKDLSGLCRDLVQYICTEVRLPRVKVEAIISGNWTSARLMPSLLSSGGYELKLYPAAELKSLRAGILTRQQAILTAASAGEAPAAEILASWVAFNEVDRDIERCVEIFTSANFRLVEQQVNQYRHNRLVDLEAVRSAANLGLTRAVYRFAPEMGFRFSTIAMPWLEVSIHRDLSEQDLVRLPEGMHKHMKQLKQYLADYPHASLDALVEDIGLKAEDIRNLMHLSGTRTSIDSTFLDMGDSEIDGLHEVFADTNNDFAREVEEDSRRSQILMVLSDVLSERELFVLTRRYGLAGETEQTFAELSAVMKVSNERVRQIEVQALGKLQQSAFGGELLEMWGDLK